jgi:hypothetical protein
MNRRSLLATTAASMVMGAVRAAGPASPASAEASDIPAGRPDGLNPPGIRVAGIRMLLAIEYALHHQQHLRGLVISDMTAGMQSYLERTECIKRQLPPDTLARLTELEAKEDYDSPEYQKIMMEDLYPKMICRVQPWPEPVSRAFRHANDKIYNFMQGRANSWSPATSRIGSAGTACMKSRSRLSRSTADMMRWIPKT